MSKSPSGPSRPVRTAPSRNTKNSNRAQPSSARARRSSSPTPAQAPAARFRTRHPVLTALVPVVLVVAAIVTMVVIKAAGNANSQRLGVLAAGYRRRSGHRRPGHHHAVEPGPRSPRRADRDTRCGGKPVIGGPAHQNR